MIPPIPTPGIIKAKSKIRATVRKPDSVSGSDPNQILHRRSSYGSSTTNNGAFSRTDSNNQIFNYNNHRRNSYGCSADDLSLKSTDEVYRGYSPASKKCRKLPVMLQFHGGGFEDGLKVLHWLAKQANLTECSKSSLGSKQIADAFGTSMVEPWVAAHFGGASMVEHQ